MAYSEPVENNQLYVSLNPVDSNMTRVMLNHPNRLHPNVSPPQPPNPHPNQFQSYGSPSNVTLASSVSPKSSSVQSFHQAKQRPSVDTTSITSPMMPMNVKSMILHGVSKNEILRNWLASIKCEEYLKNFVDNGYDMSLINRMTPQDLTAIGCKAPEIRKKLLSEIKKLNLDDDIPDHRPPSLEIWLELLKLSEYYPRLCSEGYSSIDKVCELTWEDLEEIGIHKLGHQKRLLLGIEKVKKFDKQQEERQNEYAIYDVNPNHRMSLNQNYSDNRLSTISRSTVRSGFFQTRSGANLDHRGLPVATVTPALKHVNTSLANLDISKPIIPNVPEKGMNTHIQITNVIRMNELTSTMKRNPLPPLPPVRTNSLKFPQDSIGSQNSYNNNSIYGVAQTNGGLLIGSTSFLRTPKLGTLTATTNKMLTSGGHIQPIVPVREAPPPPPLPAGLPPTIPERIDEESTMVQATLSGLSHPIEKITDTTILNSTSIGHQLASADEFPPPPPPSSQC